MRLQTLAAITILAGGSALLAACGPSTNDADEAAIREVNRKWQELVAAKDAKAIAATVYAEDGQLLPPNEPKAVGREAVEKGWTALANIPGIKLTWETEKFVFARSGELAVETGTYKLTIGEGPGQMTELGKTVVTWQKRDGKWQVLTDMFSSNAAPTAPAAPAPAAEAVPAEAPAAETPATDAAPATPPAN